jgi:hypothetical protein
MLIFWVFMPWNIEGSKKMFQRNLLPPSFSEMLVNNSNITLFKNPDQHLNHRRLFLSDKGLRTLNSLTN